MSYLTPQLFMSFRYVVVRPIRPVPFASVTPTQICEEQKTVFTRLNHYKKLYILKILAPL